MAEPRVKKARPGIDGLLERFAKVEKQNRRLRWVCVVLGMLSGVGVLVAAVGLLAPYHAPLRSHLDRLFLGRPNVKPQRNAVEAERFVLRDAEGNMRGEFGMRDDGALALNLYDKDAKVRAGVDVSSDGVPTLWVAADGSRTTLTAAGLEQSTSGPGDVRLTRVALGVRPDGTPGLALSDTGGRNRAGMVLKPDGSPNLQLYDRDGKTGALLDVPGDGSRLGLFRNGVVRAGLGFGPGGSRLGLYAADGSERATMALTEDGATGMVFRDGGEAERISLGALPGGTSGLTVSDRKGVRREALSLLPDGTPHLELLDDGGQRRAILGLWTDGLPALELRDKSSIRAVLGVASLERSSKGASKSAATKTPPSSLTLFGKDGGIVYQAPAM